MLRAIRSGERRPPPEMVEAIAQGIVEFLMQYAVSGSVLDGRK